MPSFREAIASRLLAPEYSELKHASSALWSAFERRPYWITAEDLQELDQRTVDLFLRHRNDKELTLFGVDDPDETDRLAAVKDSRKLYRWDVISKRLIGLWTDYGFGQAVEIVPDMATAKRIWEEFEDAPRNRPILGERNLHKLSDILLVDGEIFLVFFTSTLDGEVTVRKILTDEITDIITDPDDVDVPLYYVRKYTPKGQAMPKVIYYKDWLASDEQLARVKIADGAVSADTLSAHTDVVIQHLAHDTLKNRGWPLLTASAPWSRAYRDFLQNRAAVSRAVAMYVDKLVARTGSRGIESIKSMLQSALNNPNADYETNPPAPAGSAWLENEALSRQRMPLTTGAGDAQIDGGALLAQAAIGAGVFSHYAGRGETFRLATATAMEGPLLRQWQRYQGYWADAWRDMVVLVLTMQEQYNSRKFSKKTAQVSSDALVQVDSRLLALALSLGVKDAFLPRDIAMLLFLQALGVKNVSEIIEREFPKGKDKKDIEQQGDDEDDDNGHKKVLQPMNPYPTTDYQNPNRSSDVPD